MNSHACRTAFALHVLFLAGGNGRAAQLAAHWAQALAGGHLQIEAADFDGMSLVPALNGTQVSLVVVIHAPGDPEPVVIHTSGGRIDWYLEVNVTGSPAELASQVRRHVMRLLGDLGIAQARPDVPATHSSYPSPVFEHPNRLDARACLLAA